MFSLFCGIFVPISFIKVTFFTYGRKIRLCGGALISANFVLTAAHCVFRIESKDHPLCFASRVHRSCFRNPKDIYLFLVGSENYEPLKARKVIGHPKYSFRWDAYDIALIQLSTPVRCGKKIMPICLTAKNLEKLGQQLTIAGLGANTPEGTVVNLESFLRKTVLHLYNSTHY
ncbi:hypothetical protein AVEN_25-1, partial [Araneus ventricosus]